MRKANHSEPTVRSLIPFTAASRAKLRFVHRVCIAAYVAFAAREISRPKVARAGASCQFQKKSPLSFSLCEISMSVYPNLKVNSLRCVNLLIGTKASKALIKPSKVLFCSGIFIYAARITRRDNRVASIPDFPESVIHPLPPVVQIFRCILLNIYRISKCITTMSKFPRIE